MRAFVAVDLGSEEVRRSVQEVQRVLERSGADVKSVEPENLHFTLQFLDEISEREADMVTAALEGLEASRFTVSFKGVGYFPSSQRISVIWVGVDEGSEEFVSLAEQVFERLLPLNFRPDKKFVPHLTICRVKTGRNKDKLLAAADRYRDVDFGTDLVSSVKLKVSQLTPRGPIYSDRSLKALA
ncbi:MAG: RNA 2',3'-cyclic phosphodiesterase [Thaumarchaeota archaeon]|nr:RNA 2',3'-cyclic phosphodiesterase [Nitrososphaerota archaeon]MCL5318898.1 RNA 2',3'-cyclic phosphodiesterase [Nitrososphaerota archaeon]